MIIPFYLANLGMGGGAQVAALISYVEPSSAKLVNADMSIGDVEPRLVGLKSSATSVSYVNPLNVYLVH